MADPTQATEFRSCGILPSTAKAPIICKRGTGEACRSFSRRGDEGIVMLHNLEKAGDMTMDRIKKAANNTVQAAKNTTDWAKAGYGSARDAVTAKPLVLGAASLGFGALMGGLYALWQRGAAKARPARKTLPVRAPAKQSLRKMTNGTGSGGKRKAKRTARAPRSMDS